MELRDFLLYILGGGAAIGGAVFAALGNIPAFGALSPAMKRWVVVFVSGIIGIAAWAAALGLGYVPTPDVITPNFYAENIWKYGIMTGAVAFTSATLIHGQVELPKQ